MSEENDIYQQDVPMEEELEAMMPDGYADGDDFFNPETWTGESAADSASADDSQPEGEGTQTDTGTEGAPATESAEEPAPADNGDNDAPAPATDEPETTPSTKRRVRYQFDHEDREEEIDDADLPELLQKARSVDRYKQRLDSAQSIQDKLSNTARALKYDNAEAFLDAILENARASEMENLRGKGVPDELAEDYIQRKYGAVPATPPQREEPPAQAQTTQSPGRDFQSEAEEFLRARKDMIGKDLPDEVKSEWVRSGKPLLQVYTEYERKASVAEAEKAKTEAEKLRKENRILKNNADSADRAPVSGVSKGGRAEDTSANDPFLKGFNSIFD